MGRENTSRKVRRGVKKTLESIPELKMEESFGYSSRVWGIYKDEWEKKKKIFLQHYSWTFNKILCCMWLFLPPKIVFIWLWHHKETRLHEDQGYDLYMDYCSSHLYNVLDTPFKPPPRHQSDILKIKIWLWQYLV